MLPIILIPFISLVQGISLPRRDESTPSGGPVYVACVTDTTFSSLNSGIGINATTREECSLSCTTTKWDVAYYREDNSSCHCTTVEESPKSDEIVYAIDQVGNCRSQDDASVEYLHSSYTLCECILPPLPNSTTNFTSPSSIQCLTDCPGDTSTISIRPEYNSVKDTFEYECGCYTDTTGSQIGEGEGQKTDCGFGIESIYVKV
ncbi:uncharacterized protein IL334_000980 [Kwoniella shivajii]|uniref:WSC domain-containing protein n=1 Tax=Kwoniella shivajii TaxID=564305 RepID=A0ABZ1CRR2_9TREE|nr:hypothetical protein IL334_000980 [Kwoniella shivajii]